MSDGDLEDFSTKAGLEIYWTDAAGRHHKVSPAVLRSVLSSLGYAVASAEEIDDSRYRLESENNEVSGLVTAWAGEEISLAGKTYRAPDEFGYHQVEINGQQRP